MLVLQTSLKHYRTTFGLIYINIVRVEYLIWMSIHSHTLHSSIKLKKKLLSRAALHASNKLMSTCRILWRITHTQCYVPLWTMTSYVIPGFQVFIECSFHCIVSSKTYCDRFSFTHYSSPYGIERDFHSQDETFSSTSWVGCFTFRISCRVLTWNPCYIPFSFTFYFLLFFLPLIVY